MSTPTRNRLASAILLLAATLAGCTTMPVTSMVKLARVDLSSTDPALLRAAIKLPNGLRIRPHGNALRITVRLRNGEEETQDFALQPATDPSEHAALRAERDAGTHVAAYRIDPAELARVTAFRDRLKSRQQATGGSGGTLTISVRPQACRAGALPDGAILFTTYLRTQETNSYVPLARDLDLRGLAPSQDIATLIPPCE
jgi:hypothetical protein